MIQLISIEDQKGKFSHYPVYHGNDLGLTYTQANSTFRLWAPTADEVQLVIYHDGIRNDECYSEMMERDNNGVWIMTLPGDWKGKFYVFRALIENIWMHEVADPYATCVGVNGKRAMIIDLADSNPAGWESDKSPLLIAKTDAIIYELHIRDVSISQSSGIINKGKYKGLTEPGTTNEAGLPTGLDHIRELGVTHVHLLPFYDFYSIDESKTDQPQYNWGYEPMNYNVPEGSYAIDAFDGIGRIRELKEMIRALHENGLRVIMDVTYNHTMDATMSAFNQLVPGYYYRQNEYDELSNATACGNETASERAMMRKFILDSLTFWVNEYHIDGFRFDLMGVHDMVTMNLVSKELHKLRPDILLYGEGWAAGDSPLPMSMRAIKENVSHLNRIAVYSDDIRDAIRGNVFDPADNGFVSGKPAMEDSIKFGITAACRHPQVNYNNVNYSRIPYASQPYQTITYCDCHDNHILWDKLALSAPTATIEQRCEMQRLALSIILTSQGISFLHAGSEFLRTKKQNSNSFNAGDDINGIDWNLKAKNKDIFDYVKFLVAMRKQHPSFRMRTADQIQKNILFEESVPDGVVAFTIDGAAMRDEWRKIRVYYNGGSTSQRLFLEVKNWKAAIKNNRVAQNESVRGSLTLSPHSCTILYLEIPQLNPNSL